MKFVANRLLLVSGATADYKSVADAKDAPIAKALFNFPFVKHVFISFNYITITKHDSVLWEDISYELRIFPSRGLLICGHHKPMKVRLKPYYNNWRMRRYSKLPASPMKCKIPFEEIPLLPLSESKKL